MLSDGDLQALGLGQKEIIDAVENAIRLEAAGQVLTSPKSTLTPGDGRYLMTTLSTSDTPPVSVVKFVQVSPENPMIGLLMSDNQVGRRRQACWPVAPAGGRA